MNVVIMSSIFNIRMNVASYIWMVLGWIMIHVSRPGVRGVSFHVGRSLIVSNVNRDKPTHLNAEWNWWGRVRTCQLAATPIFSNLGRVITDLLLKPVFKTFGDWHL